MPVKLVPATEDKDVRFHQVHRTDGGRIRQRRFCEIEDVEVPYSEIAKGYELQSGEVVILEKSDFDALPLPSKKTIDVAEFVDAGDIDPVYFSRSYYVEPDRPVKPYVLMRDSLAAAGRVAIAKIALTNREHLAVLRPRDDFLMLHIVYWPDEVRKPEFESLGDTVTVSRQEISMAKKLIESMTVDALDMNEFHDDYRAALLKTIDAKVAGNATVQPEDAEEGGKVIDLMEALEKSLSKTRSKKAPAKKAAKKTTAKKTAKKSSKSRKAA